MLAEAAGISKIIIACGRTDLRKGIDGLAQLIGTKYDMNPFEKNVLFLFCGGRGDRIKGLLWEGNGFLLLYKRLEDGSFSWPRTPEEAMQLTREQWVKEMLSDTAVLPKGKTADGLKYSLNQEKYLKVFLDYPDVPIDNSASERAIRTFCLGKKNWMFHNTANGANSSALVYSISETAKLNHLRPYYYFRYILTELPKHCDEKGNIDPAELDYLMPWSESLPEECRKPRRS